MIVTPAARCYPKNLLPAARALVCLSCVLSSRWFHLMNSLVPLGDQAALAYFADETAALHFAALVRQSQQPWLIDLVQAYKTVAVFFDLDQTNFRRVEESLRQVGDDNRAAATLPEARLHRIPCCYKRQLDLPRIAEHTNLSNEDVIRLHSETEYTVYAIGFCPGFPYLGYLPPLLGGVPRLPSPRLR